MSTAPDRLTTLQQSAPSALQDKVRSVASSLEGERKPVTILFTDIVGSTSLAEKLDPEEWKEIVSGAHRRVSEAVYHYEGTIAQLLGDGVLAFFGAPITHEDDPIRAVHAALDIQSAIADYARSLQGYVDAFQMRVGLHTGLVVVGSVGSDLHIEYLAIGDSVNLAARLQSACEPGQVLISEATAKQARSAFDLEDRGEISVKGKAEPVHVYRAVKPKSEPTSGRGIEGLVSPLVGRDADLAILRARLEALAEGQGQIVCITGEAGIGKSRLVDEARSGHWVGGSPTGIPPGDGQKTGDPSLPTDHHPSPEEIPQGLSTIRWLEGRSLSYGHSLSFWVITQLLKADLGLSDGDPEPRVRAALRRRLQLLDAEHGSELYPYLAHLLGVKLEGENAERIRALDGETLKRQEVLSLEEYWSHVAALQPTVLVFEDLHWADPSTLEVLEHLLALTDRASIMLLLLFRSETDKGAWRVREEAARDYPHRFTEVDLLPLSASHSNELVDNLLATVDLPDKSRRLILDRSEGNPFYVEEIIRSHIDLGAIVRDGDHWRATSEIEAVTIPETLQGLLLARIDRLEQEARRTLQLASVIGQSFLYRLLAAIAEAEQGLDRQLAHLQRVDLVREKSRRPELEYIFKHALTQQAAYDSLLLEQRRDFHRRVAIALEHLFAGRKDEFLGLLAHHFDRAGDNAKAVEYLLKAGDKMRMEDAQEEAIGYYRRAIELLGELRDDGRLAATWLKLGLVYHMNFDFDAAHRANEAAFALRKRAPAPIKSPVEDFPRELHQFATPLSTLDPGDVDWADEVRAVAELFAGLAEFDGELNLVPHVARSWEILAGGTRYIFHLRDDVRWTDGTPVTASDFEWAWKRNLLVESPNPLRVLLDDIVGARDYREGKNTDPSSVAIAALDPLTIQVRLTAPVAYFPYLLAVPMTFPLPRAVVERYGDDWWKPEHIVSNGPFRLIDFKAGERATLRRNRDYFGEFPGNLTGIVYKIASPSEEVEYQQYQQNQVDILVFPPDAVPANVPADEREDISQFFTFYLFIVPDHPPLDDIRVRRALMHAVDRHKAVVSLGRRGTPSARGGLIPPGLPGHTPDMGIAYDVPAAQQFLAQAGFPGGQGFPHLKGWIPPSRLIDGQEIAQQWKSALGIDVSFFNASDDERGYLVGRYDLVASGWLADIPDPANFMQHSSIRSYLKDTGWRDPRFEELVTAAARATNRAQRMAMYRAADRMLVVDHALVLPIQYGIGAFTLIKKPWVKNLKFTLWGLRTREIVKLADK